LFTESNKILSNCYPSTTSEDIAIETVAQVPTDWQQEAAYPVLQNIGKQWLSSRTPVLKVPSAVIPIEFNYILNPQHLDLKLMLDPPMEFKFDDRMWKASEVCRDTNAAKNI